MAKSITTALTTALSANAVTTATLVEIARADGAIFRITNFDQDLVYNGQTYVKDAPFTISAITHGSQMAVDNCEIKLSTNGTIFDRNEFVAGLFARAEVRVMMVNTQDLTNGDVNLHEGWVGAVDLNENETVSVTVYGLLKILEFEVGRRYAPSCDADFGDRRCKVALDPSQAHSFRNRYHVGEWVYAYDDAEMTAISLTNPGFESDGSRSETQAITGWTRSTVNDMKVVTSKSLVNPTAGTYLLAGGDGTGTGTGKLTQTLHQDVGLVAAGIDAVDIDAGSVNVLFRANMAQTPNLNDAGEIALEVYDANGVIIDSYHTRYRDLDTAATWRELAISVPLLTGARTVRLILGMFRKSAAETSVVFDDVRLHYWDNTADDPTGGVIHKCVRVVPTVESSFFYPTNASFENNDAVLNTNNSALIDGWTIASSASYFKVATGVGTTPVDAPSADYVLVGGDDSSGVQKTYEIYQDINLATLWGLDTTLIDLVRYVCLAQFWTVHDDTTSEIKVDVSFYDSGPSLISTTTLLDWTAEASPGAVLRTANFTIPTTTRTMRVTCYMKSPTGDSDAGNLGFDRPRFRILDAFRPLDSDPIYGTGVSGTAFPATAAAYTVDGGLVWVSRAENIGYDVVDSVTDGKNFIATNMTGSTQLFVGSRIRWLTGANAGQRNIVRLWNADTKAVKLYFNSLGTIAVGDKFVYELACQKRFLEDCVNLYDNGINFRGQPYLPGKLNE